MKIVFFGNYLNHHQVNLADEFYKILGDNYRFVATEMPDSNELKGGEDYSSRPYYLCAAKNKDAYSQALNLALTADIAMFDGGLDFQIARANKSLLSFEISERWLKRGLINILSPRLIKNMWYYHTLFYKTPMYKLCSSAYAASDQYKLMSYKGKCFKWGYFVKSQDRAFVTSRNCIDNQLIRIMWCANFIQLKHPELAIHCIKHLKDSGYKIQLDMYGDGEIKNDIQDLVKKFSLEKDVVFHGNIPNEQILQAMRESDIFLFTSSRREGWGAVVNEAMTAGCCVVGSSDAGAVPYLIKDGINGVIFQSLNITSLVEKVKYILDNPQIRKKLALQGQQDMYDLWSPKHAAESFIRLVEDLKKYGKTTITEGPCSMA